MKFGILLIGAVAVCVIGYHLLIKDTFTPQQNLLFYNGTIITMEEENPSSEAVYIENGVIKKVGNYDEIAREIPEGTKLNDLMGKTLLPGFIDSPTHPIASAFLHGMVDLSGFMHSTKEELWNHLIESVSEYRPGEWILCKNFDRVLIAGLKPPHISYLDSIAPHNPVLIASITLHSYWANSLAFSEAGIDQNSPDPSHSSFYEKDSQGNLTGYIAEQGAFKPFKGKIIEALGKKTLKNNSVTVLDNYAKNGNTTITSLGITTSDKNVMRMFEHLSSEKPSFINQLLAVFNILPKRKPAVRHFVFIRHDSPHLLPASVENGDDFFKILGVKFWYDGSPYTGSMYLSEPYLNNTFTEEILHIPSGHSGKSLLTQKELESNITKYQNAGWQIAIHAQGDIAIKEILDTFESINDTEKNHDYRHRLEHCLLLQKESIKLMAELNIHPSFHINHLYYYGEALEENIIGRERANQILPVKNADDMGLIYSLHADQPMFPSEPMSLLHTAVNRKTTGDDLLGSHNAISVEQGLKALTINAAWQIKMENKLGSIKEGKYADLVILDRNPLTLPSVEIRNINVLQTIVNGNTVFER